MGEEPGEGDLSGGDLLLVGDCAKHLDQRPVRLAVLFREARKHMTAIVGSVKFDLLVDGSGKKAFAQGTEGHEANSKLFERGQDFLFRLAPPQGIFALESSNRLHRMRTPDRLH